MKPFAVADVGNSRVKWGLCAADGSRVVETASLANDEQAWDEQLARWTPARSASEGVHVEPSPALRAGWVLAGVHPDSCSRLETWLRGLGERVRVLRRAADLPLTVDVVAPDRVGIDRLLDAVAAKRRLSAGEPAVLVDAGSAVTVDWIDERHVFRGGTIFPGLRLMAQVLHDHTALLPLVSVPDPPPDVPAPDTIPAIQAGILHAVAGGIERIARHLAGQCAVLPHIFVTGGDAPLLCRTLAPDLSFVHWPAMTLEGILAAAESLSDE